MIIPCETMDTDLLKRSIARLNRQAFTSFIIQLFDSDRSAEGHEGFYPLPEAGEDVYFQPLLDSYGGSIHRVYLLHYPPLELFHPMRALDM